MAPSRSRPTSRSAQRTADTPDAVPRAPSPRGVGVRGLHRPLGAYGPACRRTYIDQLAGLSAVLSEEVPRTLTLSLFDDAVFIRIVKHTVPTFSEGVALSAPPSGNRGGDVHADGERRGRCRNRPDAGVDLPDPSGEGRVAQRRPDLLGTAAFWQASRSSIVQTALGPSGWGRDVRRDRSAR